MKILLVAKDNAPVQAFERLEKALKDAGHSPKLVTEKASEAGGQPPNPKINPAVKAREDISEAMQGRPDAVVIGMSSSKDLSANEIFAATLAKEMKVPTFFYADTFGTYRRPWLQEFLPGASLFTITPAETAKASRDLPGTEVFETGNPMWEDFFHPKHSRKEVREKLGLAEDTFAVMCPGGKSAAINVIHFSAVMEACLSPRLGETKVFISLHPGDKTDPSIYNELVSLSPVEAVIVPKAVLTASEMLSGMDAVVESASTVGIEAVCQRIPVIDYLSSFARKRLESATGSGRWPLCEQGAAGLATCAADIIERLGMRQTNVGIGKIVYPDSLGSKGVALRLMVQAIESVCLPSGAPDSD